MYVNDVCDLAWRWLDGRRIVIIVCSSSLLVRVRVYEWNDRANFVRYRIIEYKPHTHKMHSEIKLT